MSDIRVLVGTAKGIFVYTSNESRRDWKLEGPHLPGWEVTIANAVGTANGHGTPRIWAGTGHYAYGPTFRVSDDLGKTWQQLEARPQYPAETGFKLNRIWQIVGHPREPKTLFCGVDEAGLFVSRDFGTSWQELESLTRTPTRKQWFPGAGGMCLHTILIDHSNPQRMWLGISAVGCFRTVDGGATWTNHNKGLPILATGAADESAACCVHKIVQHPAKADTLFMQYHGGVLKTDDGANTWQKIESGLPGNFGFPMVVTPQGEVLIAPLAGDTVRMFKDGRAAIYRSSDEGATWHESRVGLPAEPQHVGVLRDAMAVDDIKGHTGVYFGTTMGQIYASNDAGQSWQRLPGELPRVNSVRVMRA
jgi:photosystem II stability/assembly factor-like uncharacterized protein